MSQKTKRDEIGQGASTIWRSCKGVFSFLALPAVIVIGTVLVLAGLIAFLGSIPIPVNSVSVNEVYSWTLQKSAGDEIERETMRLTCKENGDVYQLPTDAITNYSSDPYRPPQPIVTSEEFCRGDTPLPGTSLISVMITVTPRAAASPTATP